MADTTTPTALPADVEQDAPAPAAFFVFVPFFSVPGQHGGRFYVKAAVARDAAAAVLDLVGSTSVVTVDDLAGYGTPDDDAELVLHRITIQDGSTWWTYAADHVAAALQFFAGSAGSAYSQAAPTVITVETA